MPNAAYTLEGEGLWDLIYEHCSYFTERSLVTLFERCGLEVLATRDLYSGQYLGIEARRRRDGRALRSRAAGAAENAIASFAGHLLWHGVDPEGVLELMLAWNAVRCRPPLDDEEVIRTVESIERTHAQKS